jgi:two-component system sensor histidine kinase/response regulator
MPSSQAQSLHQTPPWTVFQQVGDLLKQMVEPDDLIVTEEMLSSSKLDASRADRFVVVVSSRFSALLQGQTVQKPARSHSAPSDGWCQIRLTFDPREIAIFLTHLEPLSLDESALFQQFKQVKQSLQPNDPERQSQFTLRLVERLTPAQDFVIEDSLWQQVEQERLLNEVTMLIRHSLELPVILETAVHQVRQFLQVDRLIIHQFNIPAPSGWVNLAPDVPFLWQKLAPNLGGIIYESRDNDRESHSTSAHFLHRSSHQEQAELVTPIMVRDELWGLLIAYCYSQPSPWQESEKAFLKRIVERLAIAIYQAKLCAQLQQQIQSLEQQVIDRTQALRDSLMTAQAANRAKTEFLSTMSHELRSPLTTIIGMAATLLRHQLQPDAKGVLTLQKQQEYLQIIQSRGEHLLALINDILDLSHVETGKAVLDIREFSLFQLARQALISLQEKADLKSIDLRLDLNLRAESLKESAKCKGLEEDSLCDRFKADPQRVKQILTNLLSNAIKFTPENGCVTLRVWVNEETAILRVEDNGIGIPKAEISLLFQKFQQLDASYHRKYEGTGLGLALTKQLVELHNGTIEVESTVGVGSQFTVHLPTQASVTGRSGNARH